MSPGVANEMLGLIEQQYCHCRRHGHRYPIGQIHHRCSDKHFPIPVWYHGFYHILSLFIYHLAITDKSPFTSYTCAKQYTVFKPTIEFSHLFVILYLSKHSLLLMRPIQLLLGNYSWSKYARELLPILCQYRVA